VVRIGGELTNGFEISGEPGQAMGGALFALE
jgi:hypothetical protein